MDNDHDERFSIQKIQYKPVFSVDMANLVLAHTSQIQTSISLRFAATEMVSKSISYNVIPAASGGTDDGVI